MGFKDAGLLLSVWAKAGGYYMGMNQREKIENQIHGILTNRYTQMSVEVNTSLTER